MNLIAKKFQPHHKFQVKVKISYSYLPNTKLTNSRNRKILRPSSTTSRRACNCIDLLFSLGSKCLSPECLILYQASISQLDENSKAKVYYCISKTRSKLRYANHKKFSHKNRKSATGLSNEF